MSCKYNGIIECLLPIKRLQLHFSIKQLNTTYDTTMYQDFIMLDNVQKRLQTCFIKYFLQTIWYSYVLHILDQNHHNIMLSKVELQIT